jgi:tetratricopeptide (TPR) repeat protein
VSAEKAQKLVQGGIKAVRDGNTDLARKAFTQALKLDPNNEAAWLGMATLTEDTKDKLRILKKILDINPDNERAKEALHRLAADQKKAEEPPPKAAPSLFTADIDEPASNVFSSVPATSFEADLGLPPMPGEADLGLPPMPGEADLGLPPMPGKIPASSPASVASGGLRSLKNLRDTASQEIPIAKEEKAEEGAPRIKTSAVAFAKAPQPPARGENGTPLFDEEQIDSISNETLVDVQAYLENALADYLTPDHGWMKKKRGRAGETEYPIFVGQVVIGIVIFLALVLGSLYAYIQSNPAAQLIIYGASPTPTNTPTAIPTITPGFTNTPSQTPSVQPSASPTLQQIVTPGNPDQYFPPEPTVIYYPNPLNGSLGLTDAVRLMKAGQMDEALVLMEAERASTQLSGDFPPVYHLSEWYIVNGDLEKAREVIEVWEAEWEDSGNPVWDNSQPLYLTTLARVDIAEARVALNNGLFGESSGFLLNAERRLNQVLGIGTDNFVMDNQNALTHVLLAQRYVLDAEDETALEVLDNALNDLDTGLYGNTALRMEKAKILEDIAHYDEALQELTYILYLDPFLEEALILQVKVALESGQAGLAVLYSQQYLLYYPGSVQGYWLLGQAREAENKLDLAIGAYSRGLNGNREDESYTSNSFFLPMLIRRANLYVARNELDLASEDFTLALELTDNDPAIRTQRMEAAYATGDYDAVLEDAEILLGTGEIPQAKILLMQGRAYIDQGQNYRAGLDALTRAFNSGLPSELQSLAQEYIARANYELGSYSQALEAIESAIAEEDTGSRRYLRAQIYDRRGDLDSALVDYEYVLTWGQIYPYPFFQNVLDRYQAISANRR